MEKNSLVFLGNVLFNIIWPMPLFLLSTHKQCILSHFINNSTATYIPKNLIPWQDLNPGLLVPEADTMYTAPRRQGLLGNA
jgi:hypothetical protein